MWNLVPNAVYSLPSTSGPNCCSAAMQMRTGTHPVASSCLYSSDTSLSLFSTDRLITCQCGVTGRTFSTSRIHREAIQAHGQIGSNQKSTTVFSCSDMHALHAEPTAEPGYACG